MVTSVNTNVDALAAVQALNSISSQLTSTQNQIETGLKVASASDNAAVFTIAQGLRANVNALTAVSDSLNTGIATLQGQSAGATSISNTLGTLLQTVTQAQNETGSALAASNQTITAALSNVDAFAQATTINGTNLLSSASSFSVISNINGSNTTVSTASASTSAGLGLANLQVESAGSELSSAGGVNYASGNTITFTPAGGGAATALTAGTDFQVGSDLQSTLANVATALQNKGIAANANSTGLTVVGGTLAAAGGTGTLPTGAVASSTAVTNGSASIALVNNAINQIGKTLSNLGSATIQLQGLQSFTSQVSTSTTTSVGALTDADLSAESAQLSSLQTKQSLAIQSLSLANQGPSSLLQLFR